MTSEQFMEFVAEKLANEIATEVQSQSPPCCLSLDAWIDGFAQQVYDKVQQKLETRGIEVDD